MNSKSIINNQESRIKSPSKENGFTILIAVITASLLLVVGIVIADVALKEQVLVASSRDSQAAFYAADMGMECALYWDQKQGIFTSQTDDSGNPIQTTTSPFCNGTQFRDPTNFTATKTILSELILNSATSTFTFLLSNGHGLTQGSTATAVDSCAIVTVSKRKTIIGPPRDFTAIKSRGYNTCIPSPRRLERGIEAHY